MKDRSSILWLAGLVISPIITLIVYINFIQPDPEPLPLEYFETELQRIEERTNANQAKFNELSRQIQNRDERILENTAIIYNSDRHYRDSLRAIYNPK